MCLVAWLLAWLRACLLGCLVAPTPHAPFDGTVIEQSARPGGDVDGSASVAPEIDQLEVLAHVRRDLLCVWVLGYEIRRLSPFAQGWLRRRLAALKSRFGTIWVRN